MPASHRILVIGPSGAGKSTLARDIGAKLAIPVVHLDRITWKTGWVQATEAEVRPRVAEAVAGESWVMDGNYSDTLDLRLPRATAVVWLDLPWRTYVTRAFARSIRNYGRDRADLAPGCPEQFDLEFLFSWVPGYPWRRRGKHARLMASLPPGVRGIALTSVKAVSAFLRDLPGSIRP